MDNLELFTAYLGYVLFGVGVLSFAVSVIVQVIKEMPGLNGIPTSFVTLLTSLVVCIVSISILCGYLKIRYMWQITAGSIMISFVVYLISTGGWNRVKEIWDRMKYPGERK